MNQLNGNRRKIKLVRERTQNTKLKLNNTKRNNNNKLIFVKINDNNVKYQKTKNKEIKKKKLVSSPVMRKQYLVANNLWARVHANDSNNE